MDFFALLGSESSAEYVVPGEGIEALEYPCDVGAWQYLNHEPMNVALDPDGGIEFPDFIIYSQSVPLVSGRLKGAFVELELDNLFYKPVFLTQAELGIREPYWLALPPRIDCLDWRKCEFQEDGDPHCGFWARYHKAIKIVIDAEKIGYYRIFKLPPNMLNQEIIVTESVRDFLVHGNFSNLYFTPIPGRVHE